MKKLAPVSRISKSRVVNRETEILRLCEKKKILHIGCADVPYTIHRGNDLLHKKLEKITSELWGIDLSLDGCSILRKMGFKNIINGDIYKCSNDLKKEKFDIILAGEVIEHTNNAGAFLEGIANSMAKNTELILTTVNTASIMQFIFAVMRKEKIHPDHNYYFSYYTLKHFLAKHKLISKEIYYYNVKNTIIDIFFSHFKRISPVLSDGIIVRAILKN